MDILIDTNRVETPLATATKTGLRGHWEVILKEKGIAAPGSHKWSDETFSIFGYQPGGVSTSKELFFSHVHPDDAPMVEASLYKAIETCSAYDIEHRIIRKDGIEITVHALATCEYYYGSDQWVKITGTLEEVMADGKAKKYDVDLHTIFSKSAATRPQPVTAGRAPEARYRRSSNPELIPAPINEETPQLSDIRIPIKKDPDLERIYFPVLTEKLSQMQWHLIQCQRITKTGSWQLILRDADNIVPGSHQWSDETFHLLGYEAGEVEVTLDLFLHHVHPEDRERLMNTFRAAIETCTNYDIVHRAVHRDGREMFIHEVGECERYLGSNEWIKITGTAQDITEQKKAEVYKAGLGSIIDNTALAYTLLDTDLNILAFNQAAYDGVVAEQGKQLKEGSCILDYTAADRREGIRKLYTSIVKGRKHSYELAFPQKDGTQHWYQVSLFPVLLDGIMVKGMAIAMEDITERKRASETIRAQAAEYRAFFNHSIDALLLTEQHGRIISANPAACALFRMSESEICAAGRSGLTDESNTELQALVKRRRETGSAQGELIFRRKDGSTFPGITASTVFVAENGEERTTIIIQDATPRKEAEEEREQRNRDLVAHLGQLNNVREEERTLLAHEIHDELELQLTSLKLRVSGVQSKLTDYNIGDDLMSSLLGDIEEAIKSVRRIASSLRPVVLDCEGLAAALRWYATEFEARHRISCYLQVDELLEVNNEQISIVLFRVFQETLTNIAKHANADYVEAEMKLLNGELILTIADNGVGINTELLKHKRTFGITSMRERLKTVGGQYSVGLNKVRGTITKVTVPYEI